MYDENGMRYRTTITNKEDNSVGYLDYVWVDSKLISISFTSDELNQTVKYLYNDFDEPVGFVSTSEDGSVDTYYYLKNAQGDITHIVSVAGKKMVSFTYDAWGKRKVEYQANGSTTPSHIELLTQIKADLLNPFAYRGYCYDYDMGMYYLQSRYYDPEVGRFINADDTNYLNATGTVLGCNLFAYCENCPVNNVDTDGNSVTVILVGVGVGALVGGLAGYGLSRILKVPKGQRWKYVLGGAIIGAIVGGCIGYAVGASAAGSSGIVLWSGGGMKGAGAHAANFAAKNGLKTLEMTTKGKFLTKLNSAAIKVLGKQKGYNFMKPLWNAASKQFVKSAAGKQIYVNVFISASNFSEASVFAQIEYQIVRSLGMKIIWHFVK